MLTGSFAVAQLFSQILLQHAVKRHLPTCLGDPNAGTACTDGNANRCDRPAS